MRAIFMLMFTTLVIQAIAQVCDDKNTKTDPVNSYTTPGTISPANVEKPSAVNQFNWRLNPANGTIFWFSRRDGSRLDLTSPWHISSSQYSYYDLAMGTNSNYYPSDGWELFKVNLGRLNNDVTLRNNTTTIPYIILYNKYEGKLRFFGYLDRYEPNHTIAIRVYYDYPGTNSGLNFSAFLSLHGETAQALDKQTQIVDITSVAQYGNDTRVAFWTDFPVAYDPCVCNNKSNLKIDFAGMSSQTVNLTGAIVGTVKPVVTDDGAGGTILKILKTGATIATAVNGFISLGLNTGNFVDQLGKVFELAKLYPGATDAAEILKSMFINQKTLDQLNPTDKDKAIRIIGTLSNYFSTTFKAGGSSSTSLIQASAVLDGTVTTKIPYNNAQINISVPGSKDSHLNPQENVNNDKDAYGNTLPEYPAYNEILGTFALLKTPQINVATDHIMEQSFSQLSDHWYQVNRVSFNIPQFKTQSVLNDILYAFNPIMKVNPNATKIRVAVVVKDPGKGRLWDRDFGFSEIKNLNPTLVDYPQFAPYSCCEEYTYPSTYVQTYDPPFYSGQKIYEFQTKFVPLEYIYDLNGYIDIVRAAWVGDILPPLDYKMEFRLKFLIDFESYETNRFGQPNKSTLLFTYPLDANFVEGQQYATTNIDDVLLQYRTPIQEQSQNNVRAFCTSQLSGATYKAKEKHPMARTSKVEATQNNFGRQQENMLLTVFPNPATKEVKLSYNLQKQTSVIIEVLNVLMQPVRSPMNFVSQQEGHHSIKVGVENLPNGTYFIKVRTANSTSTQKIIIVN